MTKEDHMGYGQLRRTGWTRAGLIRTVACLSMGALLTAARGVDPAGALSLKILNARAPPGGTLQLVLTLTEPKPVVTARAVLSTTTTTTITTTTSPLATVKGIALFGPPGGVMDVAGAAVVRGTDIALRTTAPAGDFGTGIGAPILAVAFGVRPDALAGTTGLLSLDPGSSLWIDPAGEPYPQVVKNGRYVIAGTSSIDDVVSGFGLLPAGAVVTIRGVGFQPGALVEIDGVPVSAVAFVSPDELQATLGVAADLYGREVLVRNPDLSRASYYGYLRATPLAASARPLLAATYPVFSQRLASSALLRGAAPAGKFAAVALQNPGAGPATVTVDLRSATAVIASTTLSLPARTRITRAVGELFPGLATPAGALLAVESTVPVQILGLVGDDAAGSVDPVLPTFTAP
jgi:hypothetical protein